MDNPHTHHDAAYAEAMQTRRALALRRRLTWYCILAAALMALGSLGLAMDVFGLPVEVGPKAANGPATSAPPGSIVLFISTTGLLVLFLAGVFYTVRTRPLTALQAALAGSAVKTGRHRVVIALTWITLCAITVGVPAEMVAQWLNARLGSPEQVARVYADPDRAGWTATNAYGVFFLLACLMVPMRLRESVRIAGPGLAVLAVCAALLLYPTLKLALTLAALALGYTLLGLAWSAWRYRDFEARLRAHALGARYTDLHGQVSEISAELKDARRLHESLFPPPQPEDAPVAVAYRYQPARQIGGDFLFIHREPNGRAATVTVIDVSGHGVAAALAVNRLHGELQRFFSHYPVLEREAGGPGHLLSNLNTYACAALAPQGVYATAVVLRIDAATGQVQWANAGHPTAYLLGSDSGSAALELPSTATMLGVLPPEVFDADPQTLQMSVADTLIVYTDGAVESRDAKGEDYTAERLRDQARQLPAPRIDGLLQRVEAHRHGRISDDTLLVEITLRRRVQAASSTTQAAQMPYTPASARCRTRKPCPRTPHKEHTMEAFERLKQLVAEAEMDVAKGAGGNKAAKVRARKKMQEIKAAAQDVRNGMLEAGDGEADGEAKG